MYYLHHYFNPDFSHTHLTPEEGADGKRDVRYLGYVQNVVAGQVLAELIDLEKFPKSARDPRFMYKEAHLPVGPNCAIHPTNPNKIMATANGYVFYNDGLISVKKMLNVRGNVSFHTGNIFFVGDLAVHGDVQTGFAVQARNILVKGHIESAKIKAAGDVVCLSGIKGANPSTTEEEPSKNPGEDVLPSTLIEAAGNIRLPFCEHVQLRSHGNLIIDGSCMHSTIYVGGNLVIKGRLQGGAIYANGLVYVEGQLGSDYSSVTKIMMGYDPFDFLMLQKLETTIANLKTKLEYFEKKAARNHVMEQEYAPRAEITARKLNIAMERHRALWRRFAVDEQNAEKCRIVVPGKIMPGCEIGIGRHYYKTHDLDVNVTFKLRDDEITAVSNTGKD